MPKIMKIEEHQTLLREALKALVDKETQRNVVEKAGLNQTVLSGNYHGRKGIGDETIAKLDKAYPEWRERSNESMAAQASNDAVKKSINLNEFKRQLIYFYDRMSNSNKEALVLIANRLYDIDHPNDLLSNPTNGKKKKEALSKQ